MMEVTWDKKIGDKGPTFKIVNNAKLEILYGKIVVYFYDKAGKQMEAQVGDKPHKRLTCAGNIFAGAVKPAEKVFVNFSCVKKDDVPKGAVTIEGSCDGRLHRRHRQNDTYWRNDDLIPERPKGGIVTALLASLRACSIDHLREALEQIQRVVRTRGCFGVILHRKTRSSTAPRALARLIVQMHVRRRGAPFQDAMSTAKPWFWW